MGLKVEIPWVIPAQVSRTRSEDSSASQMQPAVDLATRQPRCAHWRKPAAVCLLNESWKESRGSGSPTVLRWGRPLLAPACYCIESAVLSHVSCGHRDNQKWMNKFISLCWNVAVGSNPSMENSWDALIAVCCWQWHKTPDHRGQILIHCTEDCVWKQCLWVNWPQIWSLFAFEERNDRMFHTSDSKTTFSSLHFATSKQCVIQVFGFLRWASHLKCNKPGRKEHFVCLHLREQGLWTNRGHVNKKIIK